MPKHHQDRRRQTDELRRTHCSQPVGRGIPRDRYAFGNVQFVEKTDEPGFGTSERVRGARNSAPGLTRSRVRRKSSSDTVYRPTRRTDELPHGQRGG